MRCVWVRESARVTSLPSFFFSFRGASNAPPFTLPPPLSQDTVTGFLLAGVGNVDLRRNSNFLIVNDSECQRRRADRESRGGQGGGGAGAPTSVRPALPPPHQNQGSTAAAQHTCTRPRAHSLTHTHPHPLSETPVDRIEAAFREFAARPDVAVILVTQPVAEEIRPAIAAHVAAVPAVLEIPSKDMPYQPEKDAVLARVRHLLGGESAATGRA